MVKLFYVFIIFIGICCLRFAFAHVQEPFFVLKDRFHKKFDSECSKYSFVKKFEDLARSPNGRYVVYKFSEDVPRRLDSGWGDKVAGLIQAAAMAVRFNRTLLIESSQQNSLYHFFGNYGSPHKSFAHTFPPHARKNVLHCTGNDKPERVIACSMLNGDVPEEVIEFWGHREYICRWELAIPQVMRDVFGVQQADDLNQVAGCLHRLAMWPTKHLWSKVQALYADAHQHLHVSIPAGNETLRPRHDVLALGNKIHADKSNLMQIGVHFRCGQNSNYQDIAKCLSGPHTDAQVKLRGTPLDLAQLVATIIQKQRVLANSYTNSLPIALISADDSGVSAQISQHLRQHNVSNILVPDKGCQIDFNASYACLEVTAVGWFMLSLSDALVVQREGPGLNYPPSGFSRSAAMYGLTLHPEAHAFHVFGLPGDTSLSTIDSRKQQKNWFC